MPEMTIDTTPAVEMNIKNPLEAAKETEHERIMKLTAIERQWWPPESRFLTRESAGTTLLPIPHEGKYYQLIGLLRRKDHKAEPDELRPEARKALERISDDWAEQMKAMGQNPDDYRLAVTSLYRDEALQASLQASEGGHLAAGSQESTHLAGASFDFSPRSYFKRNEDGSFIGVQKWNTGEEGFNSIVIESLEAILLRDAKNKHVNFVIENKVIEDQEGITNIPSVYHVCTNPENQDINKSTSPNP